MDNQNSGEQQVKNLLTHIEIFDKILRNEIARNPMVFQNTVILIGRTGAGKTTMLNILAGKVLKLTNNRRLDADHPIGPIGQKMQPETHIPNIYYDAKTQVTYVDTPGSGDTIGGGMQDIINAFYIRKVFQISKNIKVLIVIESESISRVARGGEFKRTLKAIGQIFNVKNYESSVGILLNQSERSLNTYLGIFEEIYAVKSEEKLSPSQNEIYEFFHKMTKLNNYAVIEATTSLDVFNQDTFYSRIRNLIDKLTYSPPFKVSLSFEGENKYLYESILSTKRKELEHHVSHFYQLLRKTADIKPKAFKNFDDKDIISQKCLLDCLQKIASVFQRTRNTSGGNKLGFLKETITFLNDIFEDLRDLKPRLSAACTDIELTLQTCKIIDQEERLPDDILGSFIDNAVKTEIDFWTPFFNQTRASWCENVEKNFKGGFDPILGHFLQVKVFLLGLQKQYETDFQSFIAKSQNIGCFEREIKSLESKYKFCLKDGFDFTMQVQKTKKLQKDINDVELENIFRKAIKNVSLGQNDSYLDIKNEEYSKFLQKITMRVGEMNNLESKFQETIVLYKHEIDSKTSLLEVSEKQLKEREKEIQDIKLKNKVLINQNEQHKRPREEKCQMVQNKTTSLKEKELQVTVETLQTQMVDLEQFESIFDEVASSIQSSCFFSRSYKFTKLKLKLCSQLYQGVSSKRIFTTESQRLQSFSNNRIRPDLLSFASLRGPSDVEIKKKTNSVVLRNRTNGVATCLGGQVLPQGAIEWKVRLINIPPEGWICFGVIYNDLIELSGCFNYHSATCIGTDRSIYNITIIDKKSQGDNVFKVQIDYPANEVRILGDCGVAVACGIKDKLIYPYFEFYGAGEVEMFDFNVVNDK